MNITIMGAVIIMMSIYAFFRDKELLLKILIFFSTFTALAIVSIDIISVPILPFEFIGGLWLLREFIDFIKEKPKLSINAIIDNFKKNKIALASLIFIISAILSNIALIILGDRVSYVDSSGLTETISFSFANIKQLIIIVFVFVIMIVLSFKIKTKEEIKELLKVFGLSSLFAIIWGMLQFFMYYLGIDYPAFLFNNNNYAAQLYMEVANGIKRISSIALEPSTFSINLAVFIPFVLGAVLKIKGKISENKKNILIFCILVLTVVCAILTTSSSAYIALVLEFGMYSLYVLFGSLKNGELANKKRNILRIFAITVISCVIAAILCVFAMKVGSKISSSSETNETNDIEIEDVNEIEEESEASSAFGKLLNTIKEMTINKLQSHSGQERTEREQIRNDNV